MKLSRLNLSLLRQFFLSTTLDVPPPIDAEVANARMLN
jgi:hypothetical protein